MKKGLDKERDLVNYLTFKGFKAVRVVGSGAGTKRDTCDILAGNGNNIYAIELKSSNGNSIIVMQEQVKQVYRFARGFGAIPKIAVKFKGEPYVYLSVNDLARFSNRNGNYTVIRDIVKRMSDKCHLA